MSVAQAFNDVEMVNLSNTSAFITAEKAALWLKKS